MNWITIKIFLLILSALNVLILAQEDNQDTSNLDLTGVGYPFSHKCWRPKIKDFILSANCKDNAGNIMISSLSFLKCLKNYDGELTSYDGRTGELPIKSCQLNGFTLNCKCRQGDGEIRWCYVHLDYIFYVQNGELRC